MNKGYKRKPSNYFIKKDLQGKLTWQFFLLLIGGLLVVLTLFSLLSSDHITISYENHAVQVSDSAFALVKQLVAKNWIFLLATGLIMVFAFILLTHKIAGPIYRFEIIARNMCDRNLNNRIVLRKHDEAKELGEMFNRFNESLSADIGSMLESSRKIDQILASGNPEGAAEENRKLQNILASYKLKQNTKA
jgi:methyl-accepting chemotaxis protein